jgi:Flp pilus assembly protein TadD
MNAHQPDFDAMFTRAFELYSSGSYDDAATLYRHILASQPDDYESMHGLGRALLQMDRLDEAIGWLRDAITLFPASPEFYGDLGTAYLKVGKNDDALAAFKKGLSLALPNEEIVERLLRGLESTGEGRSNRGGGA